MEISQLKEYLEIVVDMEQAIFEQNKAIDELSKRINAVKFEEPNNPPEKMLVTDNPPIKPTVIKQPPPKPGGGTIGIGCIVGFMIATYSQLMFEMSSGLVILYVIGGTIIGALIAYGMVAYWLAVDNKADFQFRLEDAEQLYQEQLASYQSQQQIRIDESERVYQEQLAEYQRRCVEIAQQREMTTLQKEYWQHELDLLVQQNESSKASLSQIYSKGIIFPKYRNFVMVCSLYEYICAGRCYELEGHEGAYNLLEIEIRMDRIITKLDIVIFRLEQIRSNQFVLYSEMTESNRRLSSLIHQFDRAASSIESFHGDFNMLTDYVSDLKNNSECTKYHAERIDKELAYLNRMNYLTGKNDGNGILFNYPPT